MTRGETYEEFVEKFKPKKTTDDCYTLPALYEDVAEWAIKEYGIEKEKIIRPFYPAHPHCMCRLSKVIDGMVDMDKAHDNIEEGGKKYLDSLSPKERHKIMGVLNSKRYERGEKWEKVLPQWKELEKHRGRLDEERDRREYEGYKAILCKRAPESFEKFKDLKYNDGNGYSRLQDNYEVKNNIKNGTYGSKINSEKQSPHNEETREKGKSYIYGGNDFAQELFDKYAGTGVLDKRRRNQEICTAEVPIGMDLRSNTETKMFKIHHSKNRTHIVPYVGREN